MQYCNRELGVGVVVIDIIIHYHLRQHVVWQSPSVYPFVHLSGLVGAALCTTSMDERGPKHYQNALGTMVHNGVPL